MYRCPRCHQRHADPGLCVSCWDLAADDAKTYRRAVAIMERAEPEQPEPLYRTCRRGHVVTPENSYKKPGSPYAACTVCRNMKRRERDAQRRQQ